MRQSLLIIGFLVLPLTSTYAEEQALRRWALIATDDVAETGLVDLLTVHLSQDTSLQLVERGRLQDAMLELQLTALVKADQVPQRLQLGKTLRADALMVLSFERRADRPLLRVVVCDADLGVRLWAGDFACNDPMEVEELVEHCVTAVGEIRLRFSGGVQHIIAVPPFLCEDFGQRFDYLQTRYRDLLVSSLMTHVGVAIVEIEEARAILRELENTLSDGLDRPVATMVKASYRVTPPDDNDQRQLRLSIELAHDENKRKQIDEQLVFESVGHWLAEDLAERLLDAGQSRSPSLSARVQMEILSRHAQRFAALGNWEQSISLREAALVLDPQDALQRALAINEYQYRFLPEVDKNWHPARFAKPLAPEPRERALRLAAHDYCVGLDHLAYLIRNRLIGRGDALGILGKHIWYKPHAVGAALPRDPLKFDSLQPACAAQRRFLRDVYPLINALPAGRLLPEHISKPSYRVPYVVTTHVSSDVIFNHYNVESLAGLKDLLMRILSDKETTSHGILGLFTSTFVPRTGDASFDAWSKLLTELSTSERDVARIYGRFALAVDQKRRYRSNADLEQVLDEVKRMGRADEPILNVIHLQLMRHKAQPQRAPTAPLPRGDFGPLGRMHLEPISLVVAGEEDAEAPSIITGMLRCGNRDAYWTKDRFFVMDKPNVLRELNLTDLSADHLLFWEVAWDGEFIWLHAFGQGIIVVRPDGTRLATFKGRTPGYSKGHKLLALSPRRALMVGSFGESNRAWCGLLEVDQSGKPSANIFFEAKLVAEGRSLEQASADLETAFRPDGLHHVRHHDGREYVLVDRRGLSRLKIDLETLEVTVPKQIIGVAGASTRTDLGFSGRLFLRDGRPVRARSGVASTPNSKQLLYHDDWLYRPGLVWMREHAGTEELERLQAQPLPSIYWNLRAGSSAHYGLVTYDPHRRSPPLSRITILGESDKEAD